MTLPEVVGELLLAYPREKMPPQTLAIYMRELSDIDPKVVSDACRYLVRTSEFFPTIRAIRERCAEIFLALPTEQEALAQIHARQAWARGDRVDDAPIIHALVEAALKHCGGWHALRSSERPETILTRISRCYGDMRAAAIKDGQSAEMH